MAERSRIDNEKALKACGCQATPDQLSEAIREVHQTFYCDWSEEKLANHPGEAHELCEVVRSRLKAYIPAHVILTALHNQHK